MPAKLVPLTPAHYTPSSVCAHPVKSPRKSPVSHPSPCKRPSVVILEESRDKHGQSKQLPEHHTNALSLFVQLGFHVQLLPQAVHTAGDEPVVTLCMPSFPTSLSTFHC